MPLAKARANFEEELDGRVSLSKEYWRRERPPVADELGTPWTPTYDVTAGDLNSILKAIQTFSWAGSPVLIGPSVNQHINNAARIYSGFPEGKVSVKDLHTRSWLHELRGAWRQALDQQGGAEQRCTRASPVPSLPLDTGFGAASPEASSRSHGRDAIAIQARDKSAPKRKRDASPMVIPSDTPSDVFSSDGSETQPPRKRSRQQPSAGPGSGSLHVDEPEMEAEGSEDQAQDRDPPSEGSDALTRGRDPVVRMRQERQHGGTSSVVHGPKDEKLGKWSMAASSYHAAELRWSYF